MKKGDVYIFKHLPKKALIIFDEDLEKFSVSLTDCKVSNEHLKISDPLDAANIQSRNH